MDENDDRSFEELLKGITAGAPVEASADERRNDREIAFKLFSMYQEFKDAGFEDEHAVFFTNSYMTTMIQVAATANRDDDDED